MDEQIYIERINSASHKHIAGLLDLYRAFFAEEDGTHYSPKEITELLSADFSINRHVKIENIALVAILQDEVVGFLFFQLSTQKQKALINYIAVKKESSLAHKVINQFAIELKCILTRSGCEVFFYELQGFDATTVKSNHLKRRARGILFKRTMEIVSLKCRELQFAYKSPRISMSETAYEYPLSLSCAGMQAPIPDFIPKQLLLEWLEFIYLDCYGCLYPVSDPRFSEYYAYLQTVVDQYAVTLPEMITVI